MINKCTVCQLFLALLFLLSCQGVAQQSNMTPDTRVYYSVFVQSFYDSNGDGIGDIPGLTSKLDYLKDLGIGGLWLLPVHPSPTYHKYDVSDYYSIHPDYGTLEDYRTLVREAHKRNITILLDLVINHTSNRVEWFREASKGPRSPYRDYYIWSNKKTDFDAEPFHWHLVRNDKGEQMDGPRYYGFFWWEMPDLNYDSPGVRKEMIKIATFWLKDVGIDGFRLDAAKYIYPENQVQKTLDWWREFGTEVRKIKKDAFIVGEVFGPGKEIAPFLNNRMTACFNFQLADSIRISLQEEKDHYILQTWWQIKDTYESQNRNYQDALFLSNHDINRIMTDIGNNTQKAKVAASILLTLPGNPFIYYGEEIGMLGEKPDEFIREPFLWNMTGEDKGQTRWEIPYSSKPGTMKPLVYQADDPESLYRHYKSLIQLRNHSEALRSGAFQPLRLVGRSVLGFIRTTQAETIMVLINITVQYQKIQAAPGISGFSKVYGTHSVFKSGSGTISLQPYATFILKQKRN
jgi:glycosidase